MQQDTQKNVHIGPFRGHHYFSFLKHNAKLQ